MALLARVFLNLGICMVPGGAGTGRGSRFFGISGALVLARFQSANRGRVVVGR